MAEKSVLDVGDRKQLFIDGRFFAQQQGITLTVNPPVKAEMVMQGDSDAGATLSKTTASTSCGTTASSGWGSPKSCPAASATPPAPTGCIGSERT